MDDFKERFENELGNLIDVQVLQKQIEGVAGVLIHISGPTSLIENHITLTEAQVLYELLGRLLNTSTR